MVGGPGEGDVEQAEEQAAREREDDHRRVHDAGIGVLLGRAERDDAHRDERDHQADHRDRTRPLPTTDGVDDRDDRAGDGRHGGDDADQATSHGCVEAAEAHADSGTAQRRPGHVRTADLLRAVGDGADEGNRQADQGDEGRYPDSVRGA